MVIHRRAGRLLNKHVGPRTDSLIDHRDLAVAEGLHFRPPEEAPAVPSDLAGQLRMGIRRKDLMSSVEIHPMPPLPEPADRLRKRFRY